MTPRRDVPIHYLRANHTEWSPPAVVAFDTETRPLTSGTVVVNGLRLWCAVLQDRKAWKKTGPERRTSWGTDAASFARTLNDWSRGRRTIWVYAHNLSFDLTTTRVHDELHQLGWKVTDLAIGGREPWFRMSKGSKVITFTDSHGWLPVPLAQIGAAVNIPKPDLPDYDDSDDAWLTRCKFDTEILMTAVLELMEWWDANNLGRWNLTGAASGWNCYRHMPALSKITIDPDPDHVKRDRAAIHGGRRGVSRVGAVPDGPVREYDFRDAYPTVALHCPLPVRRGTTFQSLPIDHRRLFSDRWGVIAECVINTPFPIVPCRINRVNWYPVGRFRTTLAGPDIAECARLGVLESVGAGQVHQLGDAMASWAQWVLDINSGKTEDVPEVARIAVKNWGRAVIGKWAARSFDKEFIGVQAYPNWHYEECYDHENKARGGLLDFGGERWRVSDTLASENCYPAVVSFIESHVRVRLGRILRTLGQSDVLQWDTDGFIGYDGLFGEVRADGTAGCGLGEKGRGNAGHAQASISDDIYPLTLRPKRAGRELVLKGPQHYVLDGERRYAGLPRSAGPGRRKQFAYTSWPKLTYQMAQGDPRGYVTVVREVDVRHTYAPGWVGQDGRVHPPYVLIGEDGANHLLPPGLAPNELRDVVLSPNQHPRLRNVLM